MQISAQKKNISLEVRNVTAERVCTIHEQWLSVNTTGFANACVYWPKTISEHSFPLRILYYAINLNSTSMF